jgi:hypothetical protein
LFLTKKALATEATSDDIVAVRHDLPHMPSLGVSSLDSRPPWRHGGLLFWRSLAIQFRTKVAMTALAAAQMSRVAHRQEPNVKLLTDVRQAKDMEIW